MDANATLDAVIKSMLKGMSEEQVREELASIEGLQALARSPLGDALATYARKQAQVFVDLWLHGEGAANFDIAKVGMLRGSALAWQSVATLGRHIARRVALCRERLAQFRKEA